ncbi:MAG: hypothetical protein NT154_35805 [Verrucomicrobia bacterium]|nr:hypothetical protein [Verrucomicrobiota bacterium]
MDSLRIGRGCLIAGVVTIVVAVFLLGDMLTKLPRDWPQAQRITCVNNLKQIGLAFRTWALDNDGQFPFNVGTNTGGTMEYCERGSDGFDSNAALHFQVMSNELSTPRLLVCPKDSSRKPAAGFHSLQASNVTYRVRSGTNLNENNPTAVLALCPVDGNTLHCDSSVTVVKVVREPPWSDLMDLVRYKYSNRVSSPGLTVMVIGVVLLWVGSRLSWEAKGARKPLGVIIVEAMLVIVALLLLGLMLVGTAHF